MKFKRISRAKTFGVAVVTLTAIVCCELIFRVFSHFSDAHLIVTRFRPEFYFGLNESVEVSENWEKRLMDERSVEGEDEWSDSSKGRWVLVKARVLAVFSLVLPL